MKNSIFKSFRFEIVLYSLLSLVYAILTEAALLFGIYLVYHILKRDDNRISPSEMLGGNVTNNINNSLNIPGNLDGLKNQYGLNNETIPNHSNPNQGVIILILTLIILVGVTLFVIYFLILTKKFATYLEDISWGITNYSSGNFDSKIIINNDDEFAHIASNLNKMADDIKRIIENERKVENTKSELITSVAHDLRTPLTSIIGYLDLVSDKDKLTPEVKQRYLEIAYNKSKRLEKLIDDLFAYTRVSFGETTPKKEPLDLVKLMNQLIDEFYPSFTEHKLEYEFITSEPSVIVLVDGNLLARAFANLISNAIKYGKDGKRVEIKLIKEKGKVIISVINYGRLIPEKELENIFERFYRVESSRAEQTGGTGIGLAIVKSIIQMHDGNICVKCDLNGTVFTVTLDDK